MNKSTLVTAYVNIRERIKEHRKVLKELRNEEKRIQRELTDYINQTEEGGIRIDDSTVITVEQKGKNVIRSKTAYKEYLTQLCYDRGVVEEDDFVKSIIIGRIESVVQQPKLRILKNKN